MQHDHWFFVLVSYGVVFAGLGGLLVVSMIRRMRVERMLNLLAKDGTSCGA